MISKHQVFQPQNSPPVSEKSLYMADFDQNRYSRPADSTFIGKLFESNMGS